MFKFSRHRLKSEFTHLYLVQAFDIYKIFKKLFCLDARLKIHGERVVTQRIYSAQCEFIEYRIPH